MKSLKLNFFITTILIFISSITFAAQSIPENPYKQPNQAFNYVYDLCVKQNSGDKWANYMLGSYYEKGYGTKKDIIRAYVWYKMAADSRYQPAIDALNNLKNSMSSKQRTEAEAAYVKTRDQSVNSFLNSLKPPSHY